MWGKIQISGFRFWFGRLLSAVKKEFLQILYKSTNQNNFGVWIWEEYCLHPARPPAIHGWIPIVQTAMHLMSLNHTQWLHDTPYSNPGMCSELCSFQGEPRTASLTFVKICHDVLVCLNDEKPDPVIVF